jgi:hypothetical protein
MKTKLLSVRKVRLNQGGYTSQGRYFGVGAPLYSVNYVDSDVCVSDYVRSETRQGALWLAERLVVEEIVAVDRARESEGFYRANEVGGY